MTIGRLNHVGVATPSIEGSIALYRDLLGATAIGTPFDLPGTLYLIAGKETGDTIPRLRTR